MPEEIQNVAKALGGGKMFTIGDDAQVAAAHCRAPMPDDVSMAEWMESKPPGRRSSRNINGVQFENETAENLRTFELLTTAVDTLGRKDPARQKTFQSRCNKVDCALKEIFGNIAVSLKYLQQRYGFNGSHIAYDNASAWSKSELRELIQAVKDFPEGVLPQDEARPFMRFKKGYMPANYESNVLADSTLRFFDGWEEKSTGKRQSTLTHEVAHYISSKTRSDDSKEWHECSDWTTEKVMQDGKPVDQWKLGKPEKVVSVYGGTDPGEDFAESVVAYRFVPDQLKKAAPDKYEFIKRTVFDGIEFNSEEECTNPRRDSDDIKAKIESKMAAWNPTSIEIEKISQGCAEVIFSELSTQTIFNTKTNQALADCLAKPTPTLIEDLAKEEIKNEPYSQHRLPMVRNLSLNYPETLKNKIKTTAPALVRQRLVSKMHSPLWTVLARVKPLTAKACETATFSDTANYFWGIFSEGDNPHFNRKAELEEYGRMSCRVIQMSRKPGATEPISYQETEAYLKRTIP